ncbi:hypothetical protein PMAC_000666 [Pneumocystis sp. 'macacae']|nr:hypothetical protein PMAC_000666 [Pneumocystis sp. 'macacae']
MSFEKKYKVEIQQMMFVLGEVPDSLPETIALVEDIVRGQVIEMIVQATHHAMKRGSRCISIEDLIFLIRHDKPKVNRLKTYLSWKDVRKNAKEHDGVESSEIIDDSDLPWDLYSMFSEPIPFNIEEEDECNSDEQESNLDTLRLRFADLRTRTMTKDEYVHYSECRQASFTYRKSKRFREWSKINQLIDSRPNDDIIDILGFLTFEIVATITEESLRVKAQMDSLEGGIILKKRGEKYLFDDPEEGRTPLQIKHIQEGFRRLQEAQRKHIAMRGFDGGLVKNKISNQRLIFNFSTDFNFEQDDSYYIEKDKKLYTSSFIKNNTNRKNKNLWEAVSRDSSGGLIGEKNKFNLEKNEHYQDLTQCIGFSNISKFNINKNIPFTCRDNIQKMHANDHCNSDFIINFRSKDEPLSNYGNNLVSNYCKKTPKLLFMNEMSKTDSSLLIKNSNILGNSKTNEFYTKEFYSRYLKNEKDILPEDLSEYINNDLNNALFSENFIKDKTLLMIENNTKNILDECKFKKKNYISNKKNLTEIFNEDFNSQEETMPNFQKYTLSQLQSEVSKYGFKITYSKKVMIGLLTKCWKISNSSKKQSIENKKFSDFGSFQTLDNKLLKQNITDNLKNCTLLMHSNNDLECIFLSITKVLKSTVGEAYWFKILRYEPIILEMFTKWLLEHNVAVEFDIVKQYYAFS